MKKSWFKHNPSSPLFSILRPNLSAYITFEKNSNVFFAIRLLLFDWWDINTRFLSNYIVTFSKENSCYHDMESGIILTCAIKFTTSSKPCMLSDLCICINASIRCFLQDTGITIWFGDAKVLFISANQILQAS